MFKELDEAMLRIFVFVLLVGMVCSGCGSSDPPTSSTPPSAPPPVATPPPAAGGQQIAVKPAAVNPARNAPAAKRPTSAVDDQSRTSNDYWLEPQPPKVAVVPPANVPEQNLYAVIAPVEDSRRVTVELPIDTTTTSRSPVRSREIVNSLKLKLPAGFVVSPDAEVNERGFPSRIICEGDGAEMVLIDGGVFTQGTNAGPADSGPEHLAFVEPFYMDRTEVTLEQFYLFETAVKSPTAKQRRDVPTPRRPTNSAASDQHPALGVSYKDAVNYAESWGKSLPTEAEWERAARGANGNPYPWGFGRPAVSGRVFESIVPVASRPQDVTKNGLFDMAGNAREWVLDWYSADQYQEVARKDGTPVRNPEGPSKADKLGERVVKGSRDSWHLWTRGRANLRDSAEDIGFRCVLRISEEMILNDGQQPVSPGRPRF